jgi:hypothetical protein
VTVSSPTVTTSVSGTTTTGTTPTKLAFTGSSTRDLLSIALLVLAAGLALLARSLRLRDSQRA